MFVFQDKIAYHLGECILTEQIYYHQTFFGFLTFVHWMTRSFVALIFARARHLAVSEKFSTKSFANWAENAFFQTKKHWNHISSLNRIPVASSCFVTSNLCQIAQKYFQGQFQRNRFVSKSQWHNNLVEPVSLTQFMTSRSESNNCRNTDLYRDAISSFFYLFWDSCSVKTPESIDPHFPFFSKKDVVLWYWMNIRSFTSVKFLLHAVFER